MSAANVSQFAQHGNTTFFLCPAYRFKNTNRSQIKSKGELGKAQINNHLLSRGVMIMMIIFIIIIIIMIQLNLDYPDSLGPQEIVRIIEGPDNRKYEY